MRQSKLDEQKVEIKQEQNEQTTGDKKAKKRSHKSEEERLAELQKKREEALKKYDDQIKQIKIQADHKAKKRDTRIKILAGAAILKKINYDLKNESFIKMMDDYLIRDDDRKLFDLPPKPQEIQKEQEQKPQSPKSQEQK